MASGGFGCDRVKKTKVTIIDKTGEAKKELKSELWLAMKKSAMEVEAKSIQIVPVDTGNLKGSITHRVTPDFGRIRGFVGTNVEYAPYIEFGHSKKAPQGFLRPALYMSRLRINRFHEQALRNLERKFK